MFSQQVSPPPCFGRSEQYDNASKECSRCLFNTQCRQEVIRMIAQPYVLPQSVVQQPTGPFYATGPAPAPFMPGAYYVQTAAPQIRPQPWAPPVPPGYRTAVPSAPVQTAAPQPMPQYVQGQMPQPPWAPMHFPIPPSLPSSTVGYYGYAPDSMWAAVAQVPPMWRPQQPGENFPTRVVKNLMLVLLEQGLQQLVFATRQAFLPPAYRQPQTVDVTPNPT